MDEGLDLRIRSAAVETAHRMAPWRADIAWWVVGIQGLVALLVGLLLLFNQGAGEPVLGLVALLLLAIAIAQAWTAMRSELPQVVLGWRGLRAGVGMFAALLVVLDLVLDFLSPSAALGVLALGLLLAGALGVAEWLVGRDALRWRWPTLIGPGVAIGFGLVVLLSRLQAAPVFLQVVAMVLVALGVLLLVRAAILFREAWLTRDAGTLPAVSSASTPISQSGAAPTGSGADGPAVTVRSAASALAPEREDDADAGGA